MTKHQGRLELTWTDKDKTLLSTGDGKYGYTFVDPADHRASEVRLLHEIDRFDGPTPSNRDPELPTPTADNLLITGDAMHALDALAKDPEYADSYVGKVKLVYIDPPFNTGQAFTHYEDNIDHSIWLTMLRDRLGQIHPLLAPDGSVWVHLDHVESHRCRAVLDEEFGPENFVGEIAWQKADSLRADTKGISVSHDVILVYRKTTAFSPNTSARTVHMNTRFSSPDGDPEPWFDDNPTAPGSATHQGMVYGIQHPITGEMVYPTRGRHWPREQDSILQIMQEWAPYELRDIGDEDRRAAVCNLTVDKVRSGVKAVVLAVPPDEASAIAQARYDAGAWPLIVLRSGGRGGLGWKSRIPTKGRVPDTWWPNTEVGHNREAKSEIKALFPGEHPFATPKPERLLQRVIQIATNPGDIVLDCFAGSGTTAAVAHKMGRRWVTTELLGETVEKFTKARLLKVVRGDDSGGITTRAERQAADGVELPEGVSPEQARDFQRVLNKTLEAYDEPATTIPLAKELATVVQRGGALDEDETKALVRLLKKVDGPDAELDVSKQVKSQLTRLTKTREVSTQVWHGGGGFTHLQVGPSMFVEMAGMVLLADWATQGDLARAMCAQIGVRYRPDGIYAAKRGRTRYVIVDGMVGVTTVDSIVDRLPEKETVEVWATQIELDAAEALRTARSGSRLELIPDAVLDNYRRTSARSSPFGNGSRALSNETSDERTED